MNAAMFWRLVWKEYRQQRALWLAIALAGLVFEIAALVYATLHGVAGLANLLFTIALSVPMLYSLGCGAVLFAGEHEAETFPFQQSLPVTAGRVFLAKFTFAVLSALLLFPVLWLLAYAMASWKLPDARWHLQLWGGGVVATIEVLVWATLASLVLRRVLPAAVASGVVAVLLGYSSLVLVMLFGRLFQPQVDDYFMTLPLRSLCALIALAAAVKFGRQWFDEHAVRWRSLRTSRQSADAATQQSASPATGATVLLRLVWHEWRQGRATLLWSVLGYLVLATWLAFAQRDSMSYLGLAPLLATIFGASLFAADQRHMQYQFFAEHGVRPRLVWLSRQIVWGASLLLILAVALTAVLLFQKRGPDGDAYRVFAWFAITAFAAGQLSSILIRSGIITVFVAFICSVLLGLWVVPMERLEVPWLLTSLPLPFIFLGASWWYAPKWIQQRSTWRVRCATAASIVLPLCGVVAATAAYRVYEIPKITPSFSATVTSTNDSPAARQTAAMYREASELLQPRLRVDTSKDDWTGISSRDDRWRQGIDLFIAASRRETCRFARWHEQPGGPLDARQLTRAVLAEAEAQSDAGDADGAAELYDALLRLVVHMYRQDHQTMAPYSMYGMAIEQQLWSAVPQWASHDSVTPERLRQQLTRFQSWSASHRPDWEAGIVRHRREVERLIALDGEALSRYYGMDPVESTAFKLLFQIAPWERWRMSRLLDVVTETDLQGIRDLRARSLQVPPPARRSLSWDVRLELDNGEVRLIRSSDVDAWLSTTPWLQVTLSLGAPSYVLLEQQCEARRNAAQLQIALIAFRKEHGKLPDTWQEFSDHPFDSLPADPFTGQLFVYFPKEVAEEVWDHPQAMPGMMMGGEQTEEESAQQRQPRIVRSEPFLWSPGEHLYYAPSQQPRRSSSPAPGDFRSSQGQPLSETDLLRVGVRYPIPAESKPPQGDPDQRAALPPGD